ncbi:MAG: DUF1553 domain-containing protein, partial [Planctomycetaceae bacterium]|nr:DUF1553 domain-containing protein [Planctomycetaceae bacterium]
GAAAATDGSDHWAFQPVVKPTLPDVADATRVRTAIDRYVQAALETKGLGLGPEADRATLLRRVAFDVTGLPPTVAEIAAFLSDESPDAYEQMVDRYLASPHYGERWGKHWLDAAGYADSNGYFNADSDRPLAYRYRDYVVRSLNADKPFDQLIREQIAGDELAGYQPDGDLTGEAIDLLTATHFLRNAQDGTGESDGNDAELQADRFTVIEGNVQILSSALLGLTFQCARCHDHKFEPLTQSEYYGFQAILTPAYCPDEWLKPNERVATIGTRAERDAHAAQNAEIDRRIAALHESLAGAAGPLRKLVLAELVAGLPDDARPAVRAALDAPEGDRSDEQKQLLQGYEKQLEVSDKSLAKRFPEFAALSKSVAASVKELEGKRPAALERIAILTDLPGPRPPHHLRVRGLYAERGAEAPPAVPAVLCGPQREYQLAEATAGQCGTGRRSALARWLTDPAHPLLSRVTVNRIWQHHFGTGIVASADNFGLTGAPPSHPELLDYLADRFVTEGWSQKRLHREILTSSVYRQSSALREPAYALDPENKLLWRSPLRRLDSDQIRDAMLAASGELETTLGGPYVPTKRLPDGNVVVDEKTPGAARRSIYLQQRRTQILSFLEVFDAPAVVTNCTRRATSTIPLQSLSLLNSEFTITRSRAMAARIAREAGADRSARIDLALLLCAGRSPSAVERTAVEQFLSAAATEQDDAWASCCQMLLASNPFLYLE